MATSCAAAKERYRREVIDALPRSPGEECPFPNAMQIETQWVDSGPARAIE